MTAPLGRAVIGGLVVSTFATLLVLPSMFALVMGRSKKVSPSVDPDDPASLHYDGGEPFPAVHGEARPTEPEEPQPGGPPSPGEAYPERPERPPDNEFPNSPGGT